ncbi:MAG TPA: 30S ribosomal protein S9, partial [Deltaproteobacteria bacterium]|nr:30S ribosomal protein S9 [Deltaproteobacteria bacterium]
MAERIYATGRRKNSTARVWISPGNGEFTVNGRPLDEYFGRETLRMSALEPFDVTDTKGHFNV